MVWAVQKRTPRSPSRGHWPKIKKSQLYFLHRCPKTIFCSFWWHPYLKKSFCLASSEINEVKVHDRHTNLWHNMLLDEICYLPTCFFCRGLRRLLIIDNYFYLRPSKFHNYWTICDLKFQIYKVNYINPLAVHFTNSIQFLKLPFMGNLGSNVDLMDQYYDYLFNWLAQDIPLPLCE